MTTMAAQPLAEDNGPLSPWWLRAVGIVMVFGFSGLIVITLLAYRNAPPVPERVVDAQGVTVFTGEDVREGQTVFLKYGLMSNGSIWGHGSYLGPDYSALACTGWAHTRGKRSRKSASSSRSRPCPRRSKPP